MCPGDYFQSLLDFQRILCKMESTEVYGLIWINSDNFTNTFLA